MDVLGLWLTRLSRLNAAALEERAAGLGLTTSEAVVLTTLVMSGPTLNPSRLHGLVLQSPGGLTKTLRRLEAAGFVRRRADPNDRRALLVEITSRGRRMAARIDDVVGDHYDDLLADVAGDRGVLTDLVRRMLDRLEDATGMPSSAGLAGTVGHRQ